MARKDSRRFPVISLEPAGVGEFVKCWAPLYADSREHLYDNNIGKPLTPARVRDLFVWKNGGNLSALKQKSVEENYIGRLGEVHRLSADLRPEEFLDRFSVGGAIWRIFWLHCWQPDRFPIYDQHVHRSMTFIEDGSPEELGEYDNRPKTKISLYLDRYMDFHDRFPTMVSRQVDRALFSFGRFIKAYGMILPSRPG